MNARIHGIQVALPTVVETSSGPLRTAMCKRPVVGPVELGAEALAGDGCADLKHHGHEDQAVCVMPIEHYAFWRARLGHTEDSFPCGSFGDNFTVSGLLETDIREGDLWRIGTAEVEVTKPRQPCSTLNKVWDAKDFVAVMGREGNTGWYLRVRKEGIVTAGDAIELLHSDPSAPTIAAMWAAKRGKGKASS